MDKIRFLLSGVEKELEYFRESFQNLSKKDIYFSAYEIFVCETIAETLIQLLEEGMDNEVFNEIQLCSMFEYIECLLHGIVDSYMGSSGAYSITEHDDVVALIFEYIGGLYERL